MREFSASLHNQKIEFTDINTEEISSPIVLIERGRNLSLNYRYPFHIATPTSFKQNNRYVIFLILQSLIHKWEICFPGIPLRQLLVWAESISKLNPSSTLHTPHRQLSAPLLQAESRSSFPAKQQTT